MDLTSSSQLIKPCRVQITDLRKMKNQEDHLRGALEESIPSSSRETPPQGACTVLIVPNQEPSNTTDTKDGEPSEGTMLVVNEDGWIEREPSSPEGKAQPPESGKSGTDNQQSSDEMSGAESDFDIDENDADDDDWVPDPGSDSDFEGVDDEDNGGEGREAGNIEPIEVNPDEPLTNEILKKIMEVVYGVPKPNLDTLVLLKEQMDERPKLKLKLLKDLQRGHSIFKKRHRSDQQRIHVVKKQYIQTPSPVPESVESTVPQWTPHQPLTLARATAHLAAQQGKGENNTLPYPASAPAIYRVPNPAMVPVSNILPNPPRAPVNILPRTAPAPVPVHVPGPGLVPAHAIPFSQIQLPRIQPGLPQMLKMPQILQMPQTVYRPIAPKPPLLAPRTPQQNTVMKKAPDLPAQPKVTAPSSSLPSRTTAVPVLPTLPSAAVTSTSSSSPINPESNVPKNTEKTQETICFKDESSPKTRAVYMPEKRIVNIPELHPSPTGSLDVLVPVDATGQMKEPFMGIPLDSCKILFNSDSEDEGTDTNEATGKDTPSRRSKDPSLPGQSSSPNPQLRVSAAPGIPPNPSRIIPPGMVPVGLAPASARPSGVFPSDMFPPGSIPPGMVPIALPPNALHYPVPGPHIKCTCPPGTRPPGPPVHSLLHLQPEDMKKINTVGVNSPTMNHQSGTSDTRNESPSLSPANDGRAESPGIKIASVRSCKSEEDPSDNASPSLKESVDPGVTPSKATKEGLGNHPGSLLTVILPKSAKEHYKNKLNSKPLFQPSRADLKEVHHPATKVDLGLVWNEISLLRSEIHLIKTKVASDIHNIRTDMEDFVKIVGARLGITPVPQQNKTVPGNEREIDGKRKREDYQSSRKQAKVSPENLH
ncbi:proteoglycan 4-like [Lytechinus variegatus]|uniref:proteoglycan 4-like n=1 Tax=Lytechinus variegatus TaxID=7654 RepID=UPI001BB24ECC|nr:proteoglycan 4-like [Lytechinus variegatus]